jgi:23S rRNA pseudouridine2605 synthase
MDTNETVRLQKFMAQEGIGSRRSCEELIAQGKITVNGKTASLGMKINPMTDKILLNGEPVRPAEGEFVYIMLNKPRGYITTTKDEKGRNTVTQLVGNIGQRIYPVGRLDYNSEGLLLLTNDGAFTYYMTHPKNKMEKGYEVVVSGKVSQQKLDRLRRPFELDEYTTTPAKVIILEESDNKTKLHITIYEGRNRQIRRMCEMTGLLIRRLKRTSVGNLLLGEIPPGSWRYLKKEELQEFLKYNPFGNKKVSDN